LSACGSKRSRVSNHNHLEPSITTRLSPLTSFSLPRPGKRWASSHDLASLAKSVASSPARSVRGAASHLPSPPSASQLANGLDSITHSLSDAASSTAQALKPAVRATLSSSRHAATATASAVQPAATHAADAFSSATLSAASSAVQSLNDANNQLTPRNLRSLRRSASKRTLAVARLAKEETIDVVGSAQAKLSEGWVIVAALVGIEAAWLVWEAIAWELHSVGPFDWFLFKHTTPAKFYRLPNLGALFVPPFMSSILPYTFLTVVLPLVASVLLALPKEAPQKRTLAPPNPVSFSIARLAVVILSGFVFAGLSDKADVFEHVVGYPEVAVLGSAAAVLLTALAHFQRG